jgi:hypothetical protein
MLPQIKPKRCSVRQFEVPIAVRSFIPGMDLYDDPAIACTDFRGKLILPGIGHWVQQEAPNETEMTEDSSDVCFRG